MTEIQWEEGHWPKVGVGVFIVRDGKLLFGHRIGSHGHGTWAPPGGKIERGESVEECAIRETAEEAGLSLSKVRKLPMYTDNLFPDEGKHFITVYAVAEDPGGEPMLKEPEKFIEWRWVSWDDLPQPLFQTIQQLHDQGYRPPGA
jgi:8-oxo-dGTP diphosphatase